MLEGRISKLQLPVCSEEANLLSDQEWKKAESLCLLGPLCPSVKTRLFPQQKTVMPLLDRDNQWTKSGHLLALHFFTETLLQPNPILNSRQTNAVTFMCSRNCSLHATLQHYLIGTWIKKSCQFSCPFTTPHSPNNPNWSETVLFELLLGRYFSL